MVNINAMSAKIGIDRGGTKSADLSEDEDSHEMCVEDMLNRTPQQKPTTVKDVWKRAIKKVMTGVKKDLRKKSSSAEAIKFVIEAVSTTELTKNSLCKNRLEKTEKETDDMGKSDTLREIKITDVWNVLEGMGSFVSHSELDEFMMEELDRVDRERREAENETYATNGSSSRRKLSLFGGWGRQSSASAIVSPEERGKKKLMKSRKKSFVSEAFNEVTSSARALRAAAKMERRQRRGTFQKTTRQISRRRAGSVHDKQKMSGRGIATAQIESEESTLLSRDEFRSILERFIAMTKKKGTDGRENPSTFQDSIRQQHQGTAVAVRRDPFTVPSDENWRVSWDLFTMLLIFYVAIVQPIRFGFGWESEIFSGFWFFETFVDFVFLCDLFLNFRTGYINERGKMELRGRKIAVHYLKGSFAIDLLSSVPWDLLMTPFNSGDSALTENTRVLKAVRLVKLSRLGRLARVKKIIQQLEDIVQVDPELKSVVIATMVMILIAHILACIFGSVSRFSEDGIYTDSWYIGVGVQDQDIVTQYVYALYWSVTTVTTVGYGDISPQSTYEMVYASISMVIAGMFYGFVVATISAYFLSSDEHLSHFNSNMKKLKAYTKLRNFPTSLERQVCAFFSHYYKNQFAAFDEVKMLRILPHALSESVASFLSSTILLRHFVFSGIREIHITRILKIMKPGRAESGQHLVHSGDPCLEMYIIRRGLVCATEPRGGKIVAEFREHSTLFEFSLIPKLASQHYYNALALINTEFFTINAVDFVMAMRNTKSVLRQVRSNIEVLEAARALLGVSLVLDPIDKTKNVSAVFARSKTTSVFFECLKPEKRSKDAVNGVKRGLPSEMSSYTIPKGLKSPTRSKMTLDSISEEANTNETKATGPVFDAKRLHHAGGAGLERRLSAVEGMLRSVLEKLDDLAQSNKNDPRKDSLYLQNFSDEGSDGEGDREISNGFM